MMDHRRLATARAPKVIATIATLALLFSVVAPGASAASKVRWVDDDGKAGRSGCGDRHTAYRRLQAAIDASRTGDTVRVCPGTYTGSLLIRDKSHVSILGSTSKPPVIIPRRDVSAGSSAVRIHRSRSITIRGIKVDVPSSGVHGRCLYYMRGVKVTSSSRITVRDSIVKGSGRDTRDCGLAGGVFFLGVSGARVSRVTVQDFGVYGIWLEDSSGTISDNRIRFLHALDKVGSNAGTTGLIGQNGRVVITGNSVRGDATGKTSKWLRRGVSVESGTYAVVDNAISGVGDGIDAWVTRDATDGSHTRIAANSLSVGFGVGIRMELSIDARVQDNVIRHFDKTGIAATETIDSVFTGNRLTSVLPGSDADCTDDSSGGGTSGTANTWAENSAGGSNPVGICG